MRAGAGPASCATALRSVLVSSKAAGREVNDDTAQPLALTAQWPVSGEGFVGSNGVRVFVFRTLKVLLWDWGCFWDGSPEGRITDGA